MADRSWFFASQGQQQGPYPEAQFRDFIARGMVNADTLVWTEGMAGWQKAGDIPGLFVRRLGAAASRRFRWRGTGSRFRSISGPGPSLGRSLVFVIGLAAGDSRAVGR